MQNIPVRTQSGIHIGKIENLVIDIDSQSIYQYIVKPKGIKNIFEDELLINKEQIISISKNEIIVEDSTITARAEQDMEKTKNSLETEAVVTD